jgi:hypothetical protein
MKMKLHRLFLPFLRPGGVRWLIAKEQAYGGRVDNIPVGRISPHDPRSPERLKIGRMVGGDRMSPEAHNYSPYYAKHLHRFIGRPITLVEVGILRGTGLAIWSDLFPTGRVFGLDIDLSNFKHNEENLKRAGAFSADNVEVHEFDQFACNPENVASILQGRQIDVFIDDGFHSNEAQIHTLKAVLPHLASECVYFVEDNDTVADQLQSLAPDFALESYGRMTILSRSK